MRAPIAFCITELEPGGAERMLVELVTRLDGERFEPTVYCLADPPQKHVLVEVLNARGIVIHFLGARSIWFAPLALWRLARAFKTQRPRIVQTFLFHANVIGAIAARLARVPYVLTGIRVAERGKRWHVTITRHLSPFIDRHICVSNAVAEFMRGAGVPYEKMIVIPNGVDAAGFEKAIAQSIALRAVAHGRKRLLFVGRLDEQKGARKLLDVLPELFAAHPEIDLFLVGDGPLRKSLEATAGVLGVAERVHFLGWRGDVPEILAQSYLLVLPSVWEGMPNVVLEAMAAGLVIAAFDVEGVREILGPDAGSQIADEKSAESLSACVSALIENSDLRRELGIRNQRRVKQHFTLELMVARYAELYESLLAG